MPSHTKKGRSKRYGRKYVRINDWEFECKAYRLLSCNARALLSEFKYLYNGSNNGMLYMSWRDAAIAIGVSSPKTASKAIHELIDKGFIRVRTRGSFSNKTGQAATYILTEQPNGNKEPSKDFMGYKPTEKEKARLQKLTPPWFKNAPRRAKNASDEWPDEGSICPRPVPTEAAHVVN